MTVEVRVLWIFKALTVAVTGSGLFGSKSQRGIEARGKVTWGCSKNVPMFSFPREAESRKR